LEKIFRELQESEIPYGYSYSQRGFLLQAQYRRARLEEAMDSQTAADEHSPAD